MLYRKQTGERENQERVPGNGDIRRDKKQEECSQETEEVPERREVDWDGQRQSIMEATGSHTQERRCGQGTYGS